MPISLDDAVERAKLMSDSSGLLAQESYNLLLNALSEEDRYAYTMALVDRGIISKQSSANPTPQCSEMLSKLLGKPQTNVEVVASLTSDEYLDDKFAKIARKLGQYEIDEQGNPITSYGGTETTPFQKEPEVDPQAVNNLRETLENFGIAIDKDGKVSFYKSSVPGIYTDRLPQSMPLESALAYYQQVSANSGKEVEKANKILDSLSKLGTQTADQSAIINELKNYRFSDKSNSPMIQEISKGLQQIYSVSESSGLEKMGEYLDDLKDKFYQYSFEQAAKRDQYDVTSDVLNELVDAKANHPELYNAVITGLGGVA